MKQGQGSKRTRGRSGGRRGPNRQQLFDSNGPSVRIRGNAFQVHEKYLALARDAAGAGDRVAAENYYQHAEHYFRIYSVDQEERAQRQPGNGQSPDAHRRHGGNGSDRGQPHQNHMNGDGRQDYNQDYNTANGAAGEGNGDSDGNNNSNSETVVIPAAAEASAETSETDNNARADIAVATDTGEARPAPARRPRRRKPPISED